MAHRGEKVQVIMGDLFSLARDDYALAHCVGSDFRMGAGIAVAFAEKFGCREYLQSLGKVPGQVAVLPADMCGRSAPIFYLVSKLNSTDYSPQWQDFCSCLLELRQLCYDLKVFQVAMPQIGCCRDHLKWPDVERQLYITFQKSLVKVHVFKLPGNRLLHPSSILHLSPTFNQWQLLGDSNFVRFATNFASYQQVPRERYPKVLGLCVSGQRTKSLGVNVVVSQLLPNVIVMIGTNDVLQMSKYLDYAREIKVTLRASLSQLCKYLSERCVNVIIMKIPPIAISNDFIKPVDSFNQMLLSIAGKFNNIKVIDWAGKLHNADGSIDVSMYEHRMGPPGNQREDLIHLNYRGHCVLKSCLEEAIYSFQ